MRKAAKTHHNGDYHDGKWPVNNPVWSKGTFNKELTGALSSCSKKGWILSFGSGDDATIQITQAGMDAYIIETLRQLSNDVQWAIDSGAPELARLHLQSSVKAAASIVDRIIVPI